MRIDVSIETKQGLRDLSISAPDDAALDDVAVAAALAAGAPTDGSWWCGERPLTGARMGDGLLRPGAVLCERPSPGQGAGLLSLLVVGGPCAGAALRLDRGRFLIGRDASCDLVLADPDVSRRHLEIEVAAGVTARDLGSTNRTRLGGDPIGDEPVTLRPGSLLRLGDSLLAVAGPEETPAILRDGPDGARYLLRPPRPAHEATTADVVLPAPLASTRPRAVQWVSAALPAAAGIGLAWYASSPQYLLFSLLSPLMLVSTAVGDRLHWRRGRRREAAGHRRASAEVRELITAGLRRETAGRRRAAPDPATVARIAALPSSRLWERRLHDVDALTVRIGTGSVPSALQAREGAAARPAGRLADVPMLTDLKKGPLGLAGPAEVIDSAARWLVGQLAVQHSPNDVELALVLGRDRSSGWQWSRWLPHLRGRVADTPEAASALVADLLDLLQRRRAAPRGECASRVPWIVVVVDRAGSFAALPALGPLLAEGPALGLTAICIDVDHRRLPAQCRTLARVAGETGTRVVVGADDSQDEVVIDRVPQEWADRLARNLAPLVAVGGDSGAPLPARCALLEVLDLEPDLVGAVAKRWEASAGGARATVGVGGDGPLVLDLGRDGPHALIAGTTGSGKSELLQTLVAGLAVEQPPDELTFLLIDYKGGAAFADCAGLPHTGGLVTDLDPYLTERALRSLDGELRRRERLLADVGASDLGGYRAADGAEPLPRLVIVVDEFATLADELPDFLRGLVGVAQRGRSLGVHLVLATQRPGRVVSPEIRANTALRIGMRVTDPVESSDIIGTADAAMLHRSTPGRGYVRTGTELSCFQAAQASGRTAADTDAVAIEVLGPWRARPARQAAPSMVGQTDLARLVAAIEAAAQRSGRRPARRPWLPPLPDRLAVTELGDPESPYRVRLGCLDLPDSLRQDVLTFDLAAGQSLLVAGAGRSGRTQALATLALEAARQLSPAELVIHALDPAGALVQIVGELPHVGTALGADGTALAPRLLARLLQQCAEAGSALGQRTLLLVDGWDRLVAALGDADVADSGDALAQLLRVGPAAGVSVALTGDRSVLAPRVAGGFTSRVLLRQADRGDFGLAGIASRAVPAQFPSGRGLRADDGALFQFACVADPAEAVRGVRRDPTASEPAHPLVIRPLPSQVSLADLPVATSPGLVLGVAGDTAQPIAINPFATGGALLIAGPPRSGRSTTLWSLALQAVERRIELVIAAPARSPLAALARARGLRLIAPEDDDPGGPPSGPVLLLVDDCEAFGDRPAGERLTAWVSAAGAESGAVVAGRSDDLATAYRGLGAAARRSHCGILLRPGPVDGELLGVRLPRRPSSGPPGRGVLVGDPAWGPLFRSGEPVAVQVALPDLGAAK